MNKAVATMAKISHFDLGDGTPGPSAPSGDETSAPNLAMGNSLRLRETSQSRRQSLDDAE
jgi:hypothetical protein